MGALIMFSLLIALCVVTLIYFSIRDTKQDYQRQVEEIHQAKVISSTYTVTDGRKVSFDKDKVVISEL